ncbi:MAG: hypothetical protein EAZ43_07845 [Betaproteobacteria bacterium]|nr:MAG: hypothetical protein EAZ43_07845 [Betaproteobacteria bacterium]
MFDMSFLQKKDCDSSTLKFPPPTIKTDQHMTITRQIERHHSTNPSFSFPRTDLQYGAMEIASTELLYPCSSAG